MLPLVAERGRPSSLVRHDDDDSMEKPPSHLISSASRSLPLLSFQVLNARQADIQRGRLPSERVHLQSGPSGRPSAAFALLLLAFIHDVRKMLRL